MKITGINWHLNQSLFESDNSKCIILRQVLSSKYQI